ncbi:GNAT family N-acetyltransferase [Mammaliicoccus sciuri]|uniref:GNAT family N-acetyltransferase n=1 Tax=Mammaliicoccus TaxID=2803850 RepID=UPI001330372D|nr:MULTISPECIES: GNAT family N-acetyltransferase [Mammaliicoccus]MBN4909371.1 GNAT family N-acetyltransferase [Staphylococcus sp. EG-SA-13]MCJ1749081.1 GNAT family N-acetyltransferase [Mammaliicoccus sciuri]
MWTITKMNQDEAEEIANSWKYPEPYSFYNLTEDIEDYNEILDPTKRGDNFFTVQKDNTLIGYFCIELTNNSVSLGLGMKPNLTGNGKGKEFLEYIINFIRSKYNINKITLAVVDFNKRAFKVYRKSGFVVTGESKNPTNGGIYNFINMEKYL